MKDKQLLGLAQMLEALGIEQTVNFKDCNLLLGELFAVTRCSPKVGELSGNEWCALVNLILARYKGHATSHITAWANTVEPPCDKPWQEGYEHARRWVKEIGLK